MNNQKINPKNNLLNSFFVYRTYAYTKQLKKGKIKK